MSESRWPESTPADAIIPLIQLLAAVIMYCAAAGACMYFTVGWMVQRLFP